MPANRQAPSFAATMPPAARSNEGRLFLRNPRAAPLYVVGFSLACFALYFILCVYFRRERIVLLDTSLFLTYLLNGDLFLDKHRYAVVLTQLLPLLAVRSGLGVEGGVLFFSLSYVVFAFVMLVLVLCAFKDGWAALFFVYLHLIYAKALFFWPASDAMAAGSLAMLLFVWIRHKPVSVSGPSRFGRVFGITAVTVAVLFFHPLALILVLFVLGFDVADVRRIQPIHCLLAAVLLLVGMLRAITFSGYEIEGIRADWNIFNEPYMKQMARFYLENFSFGLVLLVLLLIYYFARKQPWKALVILVFTVSHALVANATHHLERQSPWYNLHLNIPLVFFVVAPFFGEVAKYLRSGWAAFLMLLMTAALGVSLVCLKGPARDIRERHQVIELILTASSRRPAGLLRIDERNMDHRLRRYGTYHLPFESMLLSGLSGSLFHQTILPEGLDPRRYVAPRQWRYFKPRAPGSLQLNQPGHVEFLTRPFKDNLLLQVRIDRQPRGGETFWPRVEIINRNPTPLRSGFADHYHLTLSYSWIKDGKRLEHPTDHTPLGIDVETAYTQYMKVRAPGTPGPYDLRVDLWLEETGWLDVEVIVPLQVR